MKTIKEIIADVASIWPTVINLLVVALLLGAIALFATALTTNC